METRSLLPPDAHESKAHTVETVIRSQGRGEGVLRAEMLVVVENLANAFLQRIEQLLAEAKVRVPVAVVPTLQNIIKTAIRNDGWACDDSTVHMSFYSSDADFYTLFWHEAGHGLLHTGGIPGKGITYTQFWEEEWCWAFSRLMCEAMGGVYCEDRQRISQLQWVAWELLQQDAESVAFEEALLLERAVFAADFYDGRFVVWDNAGIPQVHRPANPRAV